MSEIAVVYDRLPRGEVVLKGLEDNGPVATFDPSSTTNVIGPAVEEQVKGDCQATDCQPDASHISRANHKWGQFILQCGRENCPTIQAQFEAKQAN